MSEPEAAALPATPRSWPARIGARLHPFRPRLLDDLKTYSRARFAADCGAGFTVGVVALPLAMAFAIASGLKPEQGIVTAVIAGFLISALGGSSVQVGGPAGAFIVIVYGIVQRYGVANLMLATIGAGMLLVVLGWLRLGAVVRTIPVSIVIGFTNGIAVLIALSQAKDLLGLHLGAVPADFFAQMSALGHHIGEAEPHALVLGLACVAFLLLWQRLGRFAGARPGASWRAVAFATRVPGPILALVLLSAFAAWQHWPVETIGSRFGALPQTLAAFALPRLEWGSLQQLFVPAVTIALLGAVESLLCARVADNLHGGRRHDPNQELMAQGIANIVTPFFGGLPATGTIARTVTNVRAGATSPVAGMVHAATVLVVVLAAARLAASVPLAVLAGILLYVAWNMGEWHAFGRLRAYSLEYRAKLIGTFLLTVMVDLTVAMEVGLALACVVFVYRMGALFRVEREAVPADLAAEGVLVLRLYGALFFAAVGKLEALPEDLPAGTRVVVLDAHQLVSIDASGLAALEGLHRALGQASIRLVVAGLEEQPAAALRRAALDQVLGPANFFADRSTALAALKAEAEGRSPP